MTEESVPYMNENRDKATLMIRDDGGDLRKYRIELPNLIDDLDLSLYAFRLYVHLKRVAGADGACFQSTKTLAKHCKMSVGKISQAKKELADKGLINIEQRQREKGETDLITIYDIWPQNFAAYSKNGEADRVHHMNTPPSPYEQGVHHMNGGVHVVGEGVHVARREEVTNTKKEPIKKEPIKKKKEATPPHPMTKPIIDAYVKAVGRDLPPSTFPRLSPDAKFAAEQGFTPMEIEQTYGIMKLDEYWKGKTIPLRVVLDKIANTKETMRNREEADDGQTANGSGWHPGEVERIKELEREGRHDEAISLIRAANARVRPVQ